MKNLTKEDYYDLQRKLEDIQEILRNTELDEEGVLINYIASYIRLKFKNIYYLKK